MTTKLTLSLEKKTIEKAKDFARSTGRSLSDLVASYLEKLVREQEARPGEKPSPELQKLIGAVRLPDDMDAEDARLRHLSGKYK